MTLMKALLVSQLEKDDIFRSLNVRRESGDRFVDKYSETCCERGTLEKMRYLPGVVELREDSFKL